MAKERRSLSLKEFARNAPKLVERVIREKQEVVVETAAGERAILKPLRSPKVPRANGRKRSQEARDEAFLSAAGGWRGLMDTEALKKEIYESRQQSSRPPVIL